MKRKTTEVEHQCARGHYSWSLDVPLDVCPHRIHSGRRPCPEVPVVKRRYQITVDCGPET